MYADFYEVRNLKPLIYYFLSFVLCVVMYFPVHEVQNYQKASESTVKLAQRMAMAKQDSEIDIKLDDLLSALDETSYSGTWVSDMKQSKLLEQDNGTIEVKSRLKHTSDPSRGYYLLINVFDGKFRDSGHYELQIESSFIKSNVAFTGNHFIF